MALPSAMSCLPLAIQEKTLLPMVQPVRGQLASNFAVLTGPQACGTINNVSGTPQLLSLVEQNGNNRWGF